MAEKSVAIDEVVDRLADAEIANLVLQLQDDVPCPAEPKTSPDQPGHAAVDQTETGGPAFGETAAKTTAPTCTQPQAGHVTPLAPASVTDM